MSRPLAVIVLAAGLGTRTKVSTPKVLLPLCGRTLIESVLDTLRELKPAKTVLVLHHGKAQVEASLAGRKELCFVDQGEPKGTGHAVQVAMEALTDFEGDIAVVYGDVPLLTAETLSQLCAVRGDAAAAILTAFPVDPFGLGRILRDEVGAVTGVREQKDCSEDETTIGEINAGIYCYDAALLRDALGKLSCDNAQNEYYLTDTVELMLQAGESVETIAVADPDEVLGVNTLGDLSMVRAAMQNRILSEHLQNGVMIEDPATTYIDYGVTIGRCTRILPCTMIRRGVEIGEDCEVGPFSHLRVGARLEEGAQVGNFVEVKQSTLGPGTKAKHLTYLGNAEIGAGANIGAGTITANYDGKNKSKTEVADGAFIGSGTVLVAPAKVGKNAMTGAGAIVVRNTEIGDDEVFVGIPARALARQAKTEGER